MAVSSITMCKAEELLLLVREALSFLPAAFSNSRIEIKIGNNSYSSEKFREFIKFVMFKINI